MEQLNKSRWRPTRRQVLWIVGVGIVLVVLVVLVRIGYAYRWTGFGQSKVSEAARPAKTLWDWLNLLIIPFVIAVVGTVGGYFLARSENRATLASAERRAQDETLRAYLDQMGQMLLDNDKPLRQSKEGDEVSILARARTLTALSQLDGKRKGILIRFLSEARLIQGRPGMESGVRGWMQHRPIIGLTAADLSDADLADVDLTYALLAEASLRSANLRGADLSNAVLFDTDLTGATMPNGQKHEDWLKDRERHTEAGENNSTS